MSFEVEMLSTSLPGCLTCTSLITANRHLLVRELLLGLGNGFRLRVIYTFGARDTGLGRLITANTFGLIFPCCTS